jgi:hypothetical protein
MKNKGMTEGSGKDTSKATKLENILRQLVNGKNLNRIEAEHHHDHCLNSTISSLQNGQGIIVDLKREYVPYPNGVAKVSMIRYWLNPKPENIKRAQTLLSFWVRHS